jgi:iron transport multicopper oxidase
MRLLSTVALALLGATSQASAAVVRYDWNITTLNTTIFDGVRGALGYGINNEPCDKHPIDVTFGDEVEVHVTNKLTEQTCIHWHGLRQFGTQEMDGVSGITQCQIQPNVTAIYRFKPDKCGSFWYHGHEEVQYAFGLRGPLIVHCPAEQQQSWEKGVYKEYTLLLADWYHDLPVGAPIWDTVLINNVGRYNCTVAEAAGLECVEGRPLPRFQFAPGKKYLLRLINTSAMAAFKVSIDGHTFQVVASDGDYLKPSTPVNSVTINVAQRYDILVQAKSSATQSQGQISQKKSTLGSYWLRVDSLFGLPWTARAADQVPEGFNPNALAIIDYQSGATANPTTANWSTEVAIGEFDYNPAVPVVLPTTPDQRIVAEFTLGVLPANPTAFLGYISLDGGDFSSLVIPEHPPLFSIAQGQTTEELPTTTNAIKLQHNDHVEVVVVNETPDQHPFHLHAHSPWIVKSGRASRDAILAGNLTDLRLADPMQHDVFTVPECTADATGACTEELGYVVFRLNADNPGVWLMHCHIDWHFVLGLGMLFVEAEDVLHDEGLGAFSSNMLLSVCNSAGNFTL